MPDQIDLSTLLTGVSELRTAHQTVTNIVTNTAPDAVAAATAKADILTRDAALTEQVAETEGTAKLRAQNKATSIVNALGANPDDADNAIVLAAQEFRNQYVASIKLRRALEEDANSSDFGTRVYHTLTSGFTEDKIKEHEDKAKNALNVVSALNSTVSSTVASQQAAAETLTMASIASQSKLAGDRFLLQAEDAKIAAVATGIDAMRTIANAKQAEVAALNNAVEAQNAATRLSMEKIRLDMADKSKEDQDKTNSVLHKAINTGRVASGKAPIETWVEVEAIERMGGKAKTEIYEQANYGMHLLQGGKSIADNFGSSVVSSRQMGARATPQNARAVAYSDSLLRKVEQSGLAKTAPEVSAALEQANAEQNKRWASNVEDSTHSPSPLKHPGIGTIATLQPSIAVNPQFQKIFLPLKATGVDDANAQIVMSTAIAEVAKDPKSINEVSEMLANFYTAAVYYNREIGGVKAYRVSEISGYPVKVKSSDARLATAIKVDLADPEQIRAFLTRSLAARKFIEQGITPIPYTGALK